MSDDDNTIDLTPRILVKIQADIAELKTDVAELKTDVAELKTDVAGLKADVAGLKADVAGLKATMGRGFELVDVTLAAIARDARASEARIMAEFRGITTILQNHGERIERLEHDVAVLKG